MHPEMLPKCLDFVYATTAFKPVTLRYEKTNAQKQLPVESTHLNFDFLIAVLDSRRMESISHQPSSVQEITPTKKTCKEESVD